MKPKSYDLTLLEPLPETSADLIARSKVRPAKLHDILRPVHYHLWDTEPMYKKLLSGIVPTQAVSGTLRDDDGEAASYLRKAAINAGMEWFASIEKVKTSSIRRAITTLLRQAESNRKLRRERLALLMSTHSAAPYDDDNGA